MPNRAAADLPGLLDALVDLVLPARCAGCGQSGSALCGSCRASGRSLIRPVRGVGDVVAAGEYDGPLRAALLRYKERGRRDLAGPLGEVLAGVVADARAGAAAPDRPVVLVPIVSARAAARRRGGDHLVRLARHTARSAGLLTVRALGPGDRVAESVGLGAAERRRAVTGTLRLRRAPSRADVCALLLDDVVTTGATLGEAARVLRAGGWRVCGAAVLLSVPDPRAPTSDVRRRDAHRMLR